jgi:hypothetical protein
MPRDLNSQFRNQLEWLSLQWTCEAVSSGIRQLEREIDPLPPSSVRVENEWSFSSSLVYFFIKLCLNTGTVSS